MTDDQSGEWRECPNCGVSIPPLTADQPDPEPCPKTIPADAPHGPAVCTRARGHSGVHQAGAEGQWVRWYEFAR